MVTIIMRIHTIIPIDVEHRNRIRTNKSHQVDTDSFDAGKRSPGERVKHVGFCHRAELGQVAAELDYDCGAYFRICAGVPDVLC